MGAEMRFFRQNTVGGRSVVRGLAVAGLLIFVAFAADARAKQSSVFEYTVLRNGAPIGYNRVVVTPDSASDEIALSFDSKLAVKLGFITVFSYAHQREELWRDGRLVHAAGETNVNGENTAIEVRAEDGGYVRKVNNRVEALEQDRKPLAMWDPKLLGAHDAFFSVSEDKLLDVSVDFAGRQRIPWADGEALVDHYKMTGDEERELWYSPDGVLLRAKFRNRGSDIEFVLNR